MPARLFDFGYAPALHHIDRLSIVELSELDVDARLTGPAQVTLARGAGLTTRLEARYAKFRRMGEEGTSFTDTGGDGNAGKPDVLAHRSLGEGGKAGPSGR